MFAFLILLAILFIIVVGIELIARIVKLPIEVSRKATHILTGVTVALSAAYVDQFYLVLLSLLFILVIGVSRYRGIFRSIHDPNRSGFGDLWYPAGILLAAIFFPEPSVFTYSVLVLALCDGLAGLLGKTYGKKRIPFIGEKKTYVGSIVFAVTAFGLSLLVVPLPIAIFAGIYLALIEVLSFKGMDNLILPLAAGVIALAFGTNL